MTNKQGQENPLEIIAGWAERDLSRAAEAGELPQAFELDDIISEMIELLSVGRYPILTGDSGVGKTAAVYELVRRVHEGRGPQFLDGKRFVQFSLRRHACGLKKPEKLSAELRKLIEALAAYGDQIVPFISDFHSAFRFDVEGQLLALAFQFPGMLLAEGIPAGVQAVFEQAPELEQHYLTLHLDEPSIGRTSTIIEAWSENELLVRNKRFTPGALNQALHLSHRFLARSRQPRKVLDLLGQVASITSADREIDEAAIVGRFCANYRTPRALVDPSCPLDLAEVEKLFSSQVLGQPAAVHAVVNMIGQIKAGLSDVRRPFGAFLFVGPTGVGKTHIAQLLAEYIFGSKERMIRLNMADYCGPEGAGVLFGNPDAFGAAQLRGTLARRVTGHPLAVILLDEFEKAHKSVHDRFLQLIDEGCFINAVGESISCRSTILIATTNAGAEVYRGHAFGFVGNIGDEEMDQELDRRLEQTFRFEFLNRFDQIVHFHPLSREAIRMIALRELEQLGQRPGARQRNLNLEINESVLDWLAVHGYDADYGARFLRRTIERHATTALADAMVRNSREEGSTIELTVRGNAIVARPVVEAEPIVAIREVVTLPVGTTEQVRKLDADSLLAEAQRLVDDATPRLEELEARKRERSEILEQMNEPDFWDRSPEKADVLDRFRDLDVTVRVEERLARAIYNLSDVCGEGDEESVDLPRLARRVEQAASALREWEDRLSVEGPSSLWLVISGVDPLRPVPSWIEDVARMELSWCRHVNLTVGAVGYELAGDDLARVVLSIEGPGALSYLAMEEGIHRMVRHSEADMRVRVEIIPRDSAIASPCKVVRTRVKHPPLNIKADCHGRIDLADRGVVVELYGESGQQFFQIIRDLQLAWSACLQEDLVAARVYGEAGRGAVDNRTGVAVARIKDVLKGRLDPFLEGWRRHKRE